MARTRHGTPPAYPRKPHNGQARITVTLATGDRHCLYLGNFGSPESQAEYRSTLALMAANGGRYPVQNARAVVGGLTLNEIALRFWEGHAEKHYRLLDGSSSRELEHFRYALRPLLDLFGDTVGNTFGPIKLKAVRQRMIDMRKFRVRFIGRDDLPVRWLGEENVRRRSPKTRTAEARWDGRWLPVEVLTDRPLLCRKVINQRIDHIKRFFQWAVSDELVSNDMHHALKTVQGLREGHEGTLDYPDVLPVPDGHIEATLPFLAPQVAAMVRLQPLMGARETEMCLMRGSAIMERDQPVWKYVIDPNGVFRDTDPASRLANLHKTARKSSSRGRNLKVLPIGPKAQAILKPWLRDNPDEFLFQPCEARAVMHSARREERKTPLYPSHQRYQAKKRKSDPKRMPRNHYDRHSYAQAIARAAKKAGVPHWHPHQLKHVCGTRIRGTYGIAAAQEYLGHESLSAALIYSQKDWDNVAKMALEVG